VAHKTSQTNNVVRIIPLHLSKTQEQQCEELRREAGRCWSDMVQAHVASRDDQWLSGVEMQAMFKGQYALHSQTVQALAQKLEANIRTARELRQQEAQRGEVKTRYPYKTKPYQTVTWKDQALRVRDGRIVLSNGRGRQPVTLKLSAEYHDADIRKAELTWRADHYELCITLDTGEVNPPLLRRVKTAGVDLGEINIAAVVTEDGKGIVVSGRHLRSVKRLRNKRHAAYSQHLSRCEKGSRRWRRLKKRKAQASAKLERQQRDILHKCIASDGIGKKPPMS
jgi:putative transposase